MKSRSFSTICCFSHLSRCAWENTECESTEWLLTDNIQHRYLMLLLITHSSWENYSDEKYDLSGIGSGKKESTKKMEKHGKLQLMMITISGCDACSRPRELLENKSRAPDKNDEFLNFRE
jgi:hypothetical protein